MLIKYEALTRSASEKHNFHYKPKDPNDIHGHIGVSVNEETTLFNEERRCKHGDVVKI